MICDLGCASIGEAIMSLHETFFKIILSLFESAGVKIYIKFFYYYGPSYNRLEKADDVIMIPNLVRL